MGRNPAHAAVIQRTRADDDAEQRGGKRAILRAGYSLTYQDDEGEKVTVSTDAELDEAFAQAFAAADAGGHSALRLYVSLAAINISAAGGGTPRLRGNGTAATPSYRAIASQRARRLPGSARASSSKPP